MTELCTRARNALIAEYLPSPGEDETWTIGTVLTQEAEDKLKAVLSCVTEEELMRLPNMGKVAVRNVIDWLAADDIVLQRARKLTSTSRMHRGAAEWFLVAYLKSLGYTVIEPE